MVWVESLHGDNNNINTRLNRSLNSYPSSLSNWLYYYTHKSKQISPPVLELAAISHKWKAFGSHSWWLHYPRHEPLTWESTTCPVMEDRCGKSQCDSFKKKDLQRTTDSDTLMNFPVPPITTWPTTVKLIYKLDRTYSFTPGWLWGLFSGETDSESHRFPLYIYLCHHVNQQSLQSRASLSSRGELEKPFIYWKHHKNK